MLTTTEQLAAHLDDADWVVIDTRHDLADAAKGPKLYAEGHIPGAYFMHVDSDLAGPKTGRNGRHPLPDLAEFAAKVNACGITPTTRTRLPTTDQAKRIQTTPNVVSPTLAASVSR